MEGRFADEGDERRERKKKK
jgi:hypothetical protein